LTSCALENDTNCSSHDRCLPRSSPVEGVKPPCDVQFPRASAMAGSGVADHPTGSMADMRLAAPFAEAKKADGASWQALLIPSPLP